jgi:hypothetical protein
MHQETLTYQAGGLTMRSRLSRRKGRVQACWCFPRPLASTLMR